MSLASPKVCPAWTPSMTASFQVATGKLKKRELCEVKILFRRAERITRLSP
jgi:hypothetical protein